MFGQLVSVAGNISPCRFLSLASRARYRRILYPRFCGLRSKHAALPYPRKSIPAFFADPLPHTWQQPKGVRLPHADGAARGRISASRKICALTGTARFKPQSRSFPRSLGLDFNGQNVVGNSVATINLLCNDWLADSELEIYKRPTSTPGFYPRSSKHLAKHVVDTL